MKTLQRVTTLLHSRTSARTGTTTAYQTRRVIPGPFMMGWVVDVPRGRGNDVGRGGDLRG